MKIEIINIYAPNKIPQNIWSKILIEQKVRNRELYNNSGDFNALLSVMDRSVRHKRCKKIEDLKNAINQLDIKDI